MPDDVKSKRQHGTEGCRGKGRKEQGDRRDQEQFDKNQPDGLKQRHRHRDLIHEQRGEKHQHHDADVNEQRQG